MVDLVLKNALVVFGDTRPGRRGDVVVDGGRIAEVPDCFEGEARETVDVKGMIVCPAFIDIHTHSDVAPLVDYNVESKLYQGVGLEICGNCGVSMIPSTDRTLSMISKYFFTELEQPAEGLKIEQKTVGEYRDAVSRHGCAIHYGMLIGHGTLRGCVMGFDDRDPTPYELDAMRQRLDDELSAGAFGLSLGLIYPPSAFAKTAELVALARVVQQRDAVLAVHIRNESARVFEAVAEMIEIARRSNARLEISHLKLMGRAQWGRSNELLKMITDARAEGLCVTCDQYPYAASSTAMSALLPHWAHDGGILKLLERLRRPTAGLLEEIEQEIDTRGGPACIMIKNTGGYRRRYEGKLLSDLCGELGVSPALAVVKILSECACSVSCAFFSMSETDVLNIMRQDFVAVGSDGYSLSYDRSITQTAPHPRNFGTFPRFLQTVREKNLMGPEQAVAKMTSLPAKILSLSDRGVIKKGNQADLTVFDWQTVRDEATYLESVVKPRGIAHVLISGNFALRNGVQTDARLGRVLLHK